MGTPYHHIPSSQVKIFDVAGQQSHKGASSHIPLLLCEFLTLTGTWGTWRQRRLLCICTALLSWTIPCTLGAAVCHQAPPYLLYTQPARVWARRTNGLKIVSTRAGFKPTISRLKVVRLPLGHPAYLTYNVCMYLDFNATRYLSHIEAALLTYHCCCADF